MNQTDIIIPSGFGFQPGDTIIEEHHDCVFVAAAGTIQVVYPYQHARFDTRVIIAANPLSAIVEPVVSDTFPLYTGEVIIEKYQQFLLLESLGRLAIVDLVTGRRHSTDLAITPEPKKPFHGFVFMRNDLVIEAYKNAVIIDAGGVVEYVQPVEGIRFIVDLDDSKRCGYRKSLGMTYEEQLIEARRLIDRSVEREKAKPIQEGPVEIPVPPARAGTGDLETYGKEFSGIHRQAGERKIAPTNGRKRKPGG